MERKKFQTELVVKIDEVLRATDDTAHKDGVEKALEELMKEFNIKNFTLDNFGEIREVVLVYKKRKNHLHEVIYAFSNDEFTFNFFGYPELHEIRLDYSEEFMEVIADEFLERMKQK